MRQPSGRERWRGKEVEVEGGMRLGFAIGSPPGGRGGAARRMRWPVARVVGGWCG